MWGRSRVLLSFLIFTFKSPLPLITLWNSPSGIVTTKPFVILIGSSLNFQIYLKKICLLHLLITYYFQKFFIIDIMLFLSCHIHLPFLFEFIIISISSFIKFVKLKKNKIKHLTFLSKIVIMSL